MVFSGPPFIFTFRTLSTGSAPIGQNAAVDVDGVVYWISKDNFHVYNGRSQILPSPVRDFVFDSSGTFFYHEKGTDANDAAINWSIDTGVIEVPEAGDDLFLIDRFITDFEQQTGNVNLTLYYRRYPNSTENSKTAVITPTTLKANKRIRGRQCSK